MPWLTALRLHRRRVTAWCCVPTAVGAVLVAAARGWNILVGVTVAGAMVSAAVAACIRAEGDAGSRTDAVRDWLALAGIGFLASWSVASLALLPTAWGWALPSLLLLGILCGAVTVWRADHRLGRDLEQSLDVIELAYCPQQKQQTIITNAPADQLVGIWQKTGAGLTEQSNALLTTRLCYVELRRLTLDELESRDPKAFERWLLAPDASDIRGYLGD